MENLNKYQSVANNVEALGTVIPKYLWQDTNKALLKLKEALGGDVSGYVANRLHMNMSELSDALSAEQVDGVALAMYNIEKRAQAVIIGDQTGVGKGRQAAAMIRYGLLSGYLPIFFTERYTLFSDMYRDCKVLGIKDARPFVVNAGASVVDFDSIVEEIEDDDTQDEIWSPIDDDDSKHEAELMKLYQKQYEIVYKAPKKEVLQNIIASGDIPSDSFDYLMITYSQLKDIKRNMARLGFLQSLCKKHHVLFIFDEAHRSSSVTSGKISAITQGVNLLLVENKQTPCVFLSATFAKRPESFITFTHRTALSALATEHTLVKALHSGGVPMQEFVSSTLAAEGQMIRREHSNEGIPSPIYTYLDDDIVLHSELFNKVMYFFREIVKLSEMVRETVRFGQMLGELVCFKCFPTRAQLFYVNKVLLLALKAQKVAQTAIDNVKQGRSVVIGMSDTLECILYDVTALDDGSVRGDMSALLLRLLNKTVRSTIDINDSLRLLGEAVDNNIENDKDTPIFDWKVEGNSVEAMKLESMLDELRIYYNSIKQNMENEVFHLPMSPIDVIRQLIEQEYFVAPDGMRTHIRFEECTGRAHQLEYLSPEGDDDYIYARILPRKKRHSNQIFNDFQNNKLDVILINACGAIGASAHAVSTNEVPEEQVRQRKMLIVQNDLDVNIDLQKRGRINRTGQRMDLPPLYEYIITAIPSEKRLNMMLRAKLRSLSANTAAYQDQEKDQADFIDISNKYGNEVAMEYLNEHEELGLALGIKSRITASTLLARIAMLNVNAQQDIVDELMVGYTTLEAELRRINQWDLEREFRDFEAEFVREELFTTAKAETKLGGCSYLTTYRCKQKTFPYTYERLQELCKDAQERFGVPYKDNKDLQNEIRQYYSRQRKIVCQRFDERRNLLYADAVRILTNYCQDKNLVSKWLEVARLPYQQWSKKDMAEVNSHEKSKQIIRKLTSYSNDYNHLLDREKREMKRYAVEKKRLVEILSKAVIEKGFSDISDQVSSEESPNKVIAVLRDIRFGKDAKNRFLPSRVEFIFALTAVFTDIRINLVHNKKWSNYDRLSEILSSPEWIQDAGVWDTEIAMNNNKIVERKIITGNILGAFVHPALEELKPRFITFTLKNTGKTRIQNGLLLPLDEAKIRDALKYVSIPLHEGIKYANNSNVSYCITGVGIDFSLLPFRLTDSEIRFVVSVKNSHSKSFEEDKRFDNIRNSFHGSAVSSIYEKQRDGKRKRKVLMHYETKRLVFESGEFQSIIRCLSYLDAVIMVPREQITIGDTKKYISQSVCDDNEAWPELDWKSSDEIPISSVPEKLLLRISEPVLQTHQKGKAVFRYSSIYLLAKKTMELLGLSLKVRSSIDVLRRTYMQWKSIDLQLEKNRIITWTEQKEVYNNLQYIIENKAIMDNVVFASSALNILQKVLDSEYLESDSLLISRFEEEMLFLSPDIVEAQCFIDNLPCTSRWDGMRKSIQDYIDGKTDMINSPDRV